MKIIDQVCSCEQAIRLSELGLDVDLATFYFYYDEEHLCRNDRKGQISLSKLDYPAFTVAELSVMLNDLEGLVSYDREDNKWHPSHNLPRQPTEARAKAELLIHFLESEDDYLNAAKCNDRLAD